MNISHPVFRIAGAAALATLVLAPQATHAASPLAPSYIGHAHHNTSGGSENIFVGWTSITQTSGGKFTALLEIQAGSVTLTGARQPRGGVPAIDIPISGKVSGAGKITFSGKLAAQGLVIKSGKGQLGSLGNWVLGSFTLQNKPFNVPTTPGSYTFDIEANEM